jgi:hypothetical protein
MTKIASGTAKFTTATGGGPQGLGQEQDAIVTLGVPIPEGGSAVAFLTGFQVGFSQEDGDHNLGRVYVRLEIAEIIDRAIGVVRVHITYGCRDWSDSFDDEYEGIIYYAVMPSD